MLALGLGKPHLTHSWNGSRPAHLCHGSYEKLLSSLPAPSFISTEVIGNSCSCNKENIPLAIKETLISKYTSDIPHKVNGH